MSASIELQPRDKRVLRLCYEQGFLFGSHVLSLFPASRGGVTNGYQRIGDLVQAGLIKRVHSPVHGNQSILRLTSTGDAIAQTESRYHLTPVRRLSDATLIHDAMVTAARLRLEQFWDADFIPERAIKEEDFEVVPDGVFLFRSGQAIAVEVENSDKGRTRFIRLAARWERVARVFSVLYLTRDESLGRTIRKYLEKASTTKPLLQMDWPALKDGQPSAWSIRGEVPLLGRREY